MTVPAPLSRIVLGVAVGVALLLVWSAWRVGAFRSHPAPVHPSAAQRPVVAPPHVEAPLLTIAADASDLPRGLMHSVITMPVRPGCLWLRFPEWIPGTHAPCGAIGNLAGLTINAADGAVIPWQRDPKDVYRFAVTVPEGCRSLAIALTYIANQPTTNSQPVDVLEEGGLAAVNWNNILLYPEDFSDDSIGIAASMRLPAGWQLACALDATPHEDGTVVFAPTNLRDLIDSPVLCGSHLGIHDIPGTGIAPHRLAVAMTSQQDPPPARALAQLGAVAAEAATLFGGAPFKRYTWLLGVSRRFPHLGLEHQSCSLNGLGRDDYLDGEALDARAAFLLAHEYGHAWCGKHRRPAGMLSGDFHSPLDTRLLWVYEGFDEYLGVVLAARAGAVSRAKWNAEVIETITSVAGSRSRSWRTLEDTATAGFTLRGQSRSWGGLRGSQDYYLEGMLLCFEIDGLIRRASDGKRSLDDVMHAFFAPHPGIAVVPYTEADVIAALRTVEPSQDWAALIAKRIHSTVAEPDLSPLALWGMRADWKTERPADEATQGMLDDRWSVGLVVWRGGQVAQVLPGSPADRARMSPGCRITRVGDEPMSISAWDRALRTAKDGGGIAVHIRRPDGSESDLSIDCRTGPRYLDIAVSDDPAERAVLEAIIAPRTAEGRAMRASGGW